MERDICKVDSYMDLGGKEQKHWFGFALRIH